MITRYVFTFIFSVFTFSILSSQCNTGGEPECDCSTADVLCSVNELDGFSGSMSTFQHSGPDGFCGSNTVSNNPTWFAFIAWCDDITMDVNFSNCVAAPGGNSNGVQVVVFDECGGSVVDCDASCNSSGGSTSLSLGGLTIGQAYYFMIDGCAGAACDFDISVSPTNCDENIEEWTDTSINGETNVCLDSDEDYDVESLTGATSYHWTIDGNEVDVTQDEFNTISWPSAGTFELCVDVSNVCVDIAEDPDEICTMVTVSEPNAGMLSSTPNPLCPGEISAVNLSGHNSGAGITNALIVTDPNGVVIDVYTDGTTDIDVTYDECGIVKVFSLNFASTASIPVPSIGDGYNGTDCVENCCDEVCETISFEDDQDPVFDSPPADMDLSCTDVITPMMDLMVTDNCSADQLVPGVESGSITVCAGGTITREWTFSDDCGNEVTHTQTITSTPADEAAFVNVPNDVTIDCSDVSTFIFPDLMYTNNSTGACLIEDMITPTVSDNTNDCDGTLEAEWTFTDDCGRTITAVQIVTVNPPSEPVFINIPTDMTVACNALPPPAAPLAYTNMELGDCLIDGTQDAMIEEELDECGGTITNTWEYTDPCGRVITQVQVITVDPADEAVFLNPPGDITMSCEDFNDLTPTALDYTNNLSGVCEIAGSEDPELAGTIDGCGGTATLTWTFTDACNREISHMQNITVDPAGQAMFINPPADMTLDCSEYDINPPILEYDNEAPGLCQINGDIEAIESGLVDECGGLINYTWTFTDDCGRTISESQDIEYLPAPEPEFIDPPEDITVACDEDVPDAGNLEYTNNQLSICDISGDVEPTILITDNIYEYTWELEYICTGEIISHTQTIVKNIPIELDEQEFEFVICLGGSFNLEDIFLSDINGTNFTASYHEQIPANNNNEVDPFVILEDDDATYFIVLTNEFGCEAIVDVLLIADITGVAGDDVAEEICKDDGPMDLYSFLQSGAQLDGEFIQIDGPQDLDIFDPSIVNISNVIPGSYIIEYSVEDFSNGCPPDMALLEIEIHPEIEIEVVSLSCSSDGQTYVITITNNGYSIDSDIGNITTETDTLVIIENIPIDQDITIEVEDNVTDCEVEFLFIRPDCNCPMVEAPVSNGDQRVCVGSTNPALSVSTSPMTITNWYDSPTGGNLLISNSLTYTPSDATVGLFTYYVEAESTMTSGCVSTTRTEVTLEIIPQPAVIDTTYNICAISNNGLLSVEQIELEGIIFNNIANLTALFYNTANDRDNGTNAITFPYSIDMVTQSLFVRVSNSADCQADIVIVIDVQDLPQIIANPTDVSCAGAADGVIEYSVNTAALPTQVVFRNDTITNTIIENLRPDTYTLEAIDANGCRDTLTVEISDGLNIEIENLTVLCDNNNTTSDETDDFYTINFIVNNDLGVPGTYTLTSVPAGIMETNSYGDVVDLQLQADGSNTSITITDTQNDCTTEINLDALDPCSSDCLLTLDLLEYVCDDNGTPIDASDDFYNVSVMASAINGSDNDTYIVRLDGVISFNFPYNTLSTFTIPAQSQIVNITVEDNQFNGCSQSEITTALIPCSDDCLIEFEIVNTTCDNNNTLDNNDDDTFLIDILVTGFNTSDSGYIMSTGETGMYNDTISISGNINDGTISIIFTDAEDFNCTTTLTTDPPEPCSDPCTIEFTQFNILPCDNSGTSSDPIDDIYSVALEVASILGNTSTYIITDNNGDQYGPFNYNMPVEIGPFTADGTTLTIAITDSVNGSCFLEENISQESCSDECIIEASIVSIQCDNNGTDTTEDDDTYSVLVSVSGVNISANYVAPNLGISNPYSDQLIIPDLLISDGNTTLLIEDESDSACFLELNIVPPAPCSAPCDVELITLDILDCDNNMTGDTSDDDFFFANIEITGTLGNGTEYNLRDNDGNIYGPFDYESLNNIGPFLADGSIITLSLFDEDNGSCILDFMISQMPCSACSETVSLTTDNNTLTCDNDMANINATVSSPVSQINWTSDNGFSSTDEDIAIDQAGEYFIEVIYTNGCTATDSITINVDDDIPIADAGPDRELNCDTDIITLDATTSVTNATTTVEWLDDNGNVISTDLTIDITEEGQYGLRITDNNSQCVSAIDLVEITRNISDPSTQIFADPDSIFNCFIEIINLTAAQEENVLYQWIVEDGAFDQITITVSDVDSVTLIALDTITNCMNARTLFIPDLTEFPIINIAPITGIDCITGESCIEVTSPTTLPLTYNWFDSQGNLISNNQNSLCITEAGNYTIELIDNENGCTNSEDFTVSEATVPNIILPTITTILNNTQVQLMPIIDIDISDISSIEWTTAAELSCLDCLTPTILSFTEGDIVTLTIRTIEGCETQAVTQLSSRVEPLVYIPNVFSPDNRSNFTIFTNDQITSINGMYIYDRWGNLMFFNENFSPNDPDQGWDGTYNDNLVEQGVYVYVFKYISDGREVIEAGDITLLR